MGPKDEIQYFSKLIDKLDVNKLQVYVQARIMEVSQLGIRNVGLKYGLNAGKVSGSGLFTMAAELGGMSGSNLILPSGFDLDFGGERVVTSTTTDSVTGDVTETYGNQEIAEALALGTTINLLENNDALEMISEPSVLCLNNKESSIYIGTTKSIQMGTSTDKNGNATPKLERADIGLTLKVKPRISNENKVILDITTKVEDVSNKQTNSQPDSNKKELTTTAIVNTGESVILGGYTKHKQQNIVDKMPFFGDIPIIGNLFRNTVKGKDKINLVIVVTPYIVPKSKDLTYIRNQLTQLKMLEDKFTKDIILHLEEEKLKYIKEDEKRSDELEEIKNEFQELNEEKMSIEQTGLDAHDRKLKELFGNQ
jgi:general secretion pathway protein D